MLPEDEEKPHSLPSKRNLPFFRNLRRMSKQKFTWDEESNKAFAKLKQYMGSPQLPSRPEFGKTLQLYLAISDVSVSSVLIREVEGTQKAHILCQSCDARSRGKRVLSGPALFGCLTTWAIELNEFEISYIPRTIVKAQALSDFVIEYTARAPPKIEVQEEEEKANSLLFEWSMRVDGGFTKISFQNIPREENEEADQLSRLATTYYSDLPEGDAEIYNQPAYEVYNVHSIIDISKVLAEVHEVWCGSHIGARSLAIKITRVGYYWPTLVKEALSYVRKCDACQWLGNAP
ncbi:hypothetical protein LIER_10094 [Lithospermum erythrorhizon]|uniref:Integrase zinc-binding domain-containing protein n=1 Tax=Lithospermum erythrorhizon TaxID=34254 RepID=A0AAV3PI80_LITER